ncbi:DNA-directed RNA polymerase I subunit RPA1-like [Sinocyclocheilus anshuiensis]|nr:PREDICTED: DNA-directed RNA polymerase I subunit RPA1-like [Sinocyclocheilus anshuiensis]
MEQKFFRMLLEAIKKLSAKLAAVNVVDTRKAMASDNDRDAGAIAHKEDDADEETENNRIVDDEANEGDTDATDSRRKEKQEEEVSEFTLCLNIYSCSYCAQFF